MGDAESSEEKALPFEELDRVHVGSGVSPPQTSPLIALLCTSEHFPMCLVACELATPALILFAFQREPVRYSYPWGWRIQVNEFSVSLLRLSSRSEYRP
jgi:tRNA(Arg) A34 adenosine deaminase TadA